MELYVICVILTAILSVFAYILTLIGDVNYYRVLKENKEHIIEKNLQTISQLVLERDTYKAILMQPPKPVVIPQQSPSLKNTIIEYLRRNPNTTTCGVLRGISNEYTNITQKELTRILYSLQHKHIVIAKGGSGGVYWSVIKSE
jgi:dihydrofolate reductase